MTAETTGINLRLVTSSQRLGTVSVPEWKWGGNSQLHLLLCDPLLLRFRVSIGSENGFKSCYIFSERFAATVAMRWQHSFHMVSWHRSRANGRSPPIELDKHSVQLSCSLECCTPKYAHSFLSHQHVSIEFFKIFKQMHVQMSMQTINHKLQTKTLKARHSQQHSVSNKSCRIHLNKQNAAVWGCS